MKYANDLARDFLVNRESLWKQLSNDDQTKWRLISNEYSHMRRHDGEYGFTMMLYIASRRPHVESMDLNPMRDYGLVDVTTIATASLEHRAMACWMHNEVLKIIAQSTSGGEG